MNRYILKIILTYALMLCCVTISMLSAHCSGNQISSIVFEDRTKTEAHVGVDL